MVNNEKFSNPDAYDQYDADYSKPIAYDKQGRPLYAHPPTAEELKADATPSKDEQTTHQYVHFSRAIDPQTPEIPTAILQRHEDARKKYPFLNLSEGEVILSDVRRHWIGIVRIWAIALLLIFALMGVVMPWLVGEDATEQTLLLTVTGLGFASFFIFCGALIATYVYRNNRFFLTNESVIQEIQVSLFNKHEQTVSLSNIEDASYYQNGILPHIFNYGLIRLSTEGDETTYRFSYVANPKQHIAVLNNAVEAFKNGRPVIND